ATVRLVRSRARLRWLVAVVLVSAPAHAADLTKQQVLDIIGAATELAPADLSGKDLSRLDLSGVDLKRAKLRGTNLSGANLAGANLFGTVRSEERRVGKEGG